MSRSGCRDPATRVYESERRLVIRRPRRRPFTPPDLGPRRNHRIRIPQVRVIDADGEQLGVLETRDALRRAREAGLDLVEVAPTARPPVCRILDYGKHKYEEAKKQRETRRRQQESGAVQGGTKGIRMRFGTENRDLELRARTARRFLEEGHKVQVTLLFRGRERTHPQIAESQMEKLTAHLMDVGLVERPAELDGRRMTMLLAPR